MDSFFKFIIHPYSPPFTSHYSPLPIAIHYIYYTNHCIAQRHCHSHRRLGRGPLIHQKAPAISMDNHSGYYLFHTLFSGYVVFFPLGRFGCILDEQ